MDFRRKRQLIILVIVAAVVVGIVSLLVYRFTPQPTCFDNRKNQNEEGVDCGGSCVPCALKHQGKLELSFPPRFFLVGEHQYDFVAELRNPNLALGGTFVYTFKIFDDTGFLLAERKGRSFIYPGETAHLIENSFVTERTIDHVNLEIIATAFMLSRDVEPDLIAGRKIYDIQTGRQGRPMSRVTALLVNRTLEDQKNIVVNVLLYDKDGNVVGVNKTTVDSLASGASLPLEFSWPGVVAPAVDSITIEPRISRFMQ